MNYKFFINLIFWSKFFHLVRVDETQQPFKGMKMNLTKLRRKTRAHHCLCHTIKTWWSQNYQALKETWDINKASPLFHKTVKWQSWMKKEFYSNQVTTIFDKFITNNSKGLKNNKERKYTHIKIKYLKNLCTTWYFI